MTNSVEQIMKDIKELKIQGARRVAAATAKALGICIEKSKAKNREEMIKEILETGDKLIKLRSTEPMVRNTFRYILAHVEKGKDVKEIKKIAKIALQTYDKQFTESFLKITKYGSDLIWDGQTILTHCHSTTVNSILVHAHKHKKIKVICTETRPLYQGHLTAKQLSSAGVDVTMIVDSAVRHVMKDVDLVIVGADAVGADGTLYNKIGTATIATVAFDMKIPFYSATQIYKFDPLTKFGQMTEIEMRPEKEILPKPIKGVKILNPAFDTTAPTYIRAYITELGIIPPQNVGSAAERYIESENL
jgi:ribose 1,5-bisphosphate isomerase